MKRRNIIKLPTIRGTVTVVTLRLPQRVRSRLRKLAESWWLSDEETAQALLTRAVEESYENRLPPRPRKRR